MEHHTVETVVVGGGLAGLTAAVVAARRGLRVTLVEKAASLGGRARTQDRAGFLFNMGPHALYCGGAGLAVLRSLGIPVRGRRPPGSGGYAVYGGRLHTLPASAGSLLATGLLDLRDKAAFARVLTRLPTMDADGLARTSVSDWLEGLRLRPRVRALLEAYVRVSSYGRDLDRFSAGAAIAQLQAAQSGGVLYLDGGWQTLVDGLAAAAKDAGVRFVQAGVAAVEHSRVVTGVRLDDGRRIAAPAVIVAAGPRETAALLTAPPVVSLEREARDAAPVYVASLDLALARLPRPRALFALGIDRPLYFSVHSATAALAPRGGALIHAAMYLGASTDGDPRWIRAELEGLADLVQPGWREALVEARFLPCLLAAHGLPRAAQGGRAGRPGAVVPEVAGLFIAGDWVGPTGLLADASLASGQAAALGVERRPAATFESGSMKTAASTAG